MTIESHYNTLRSNALYLRSLVGREWGTVQTGHYHSTFAERVYATATALALADWPRVRSALAASGELLPASPVTYGSTGYSEMRLDVCAVCTCRERRAVEPSYAQLAITELQPALEREAAAAEAAYETYRRAVEQGVAIAPTDSE